MSRNEILRSETREWVERARADLQACAALIAAGLPAEAQFHAQQCSGKALKDLLTWHQIAFSTLGASVIRVPLIFLVQGKRKTLDIRPRTLPIKMKDD